MLLALIMSYIVLKTWNSCALCTCVNFTAQYCANFGKINVLFTLLNVIDC